MKSFMTVILIGVSLSLDAFSLSLLYGTLNLSRKKIIILSTIVGLYHFIMPIIGSLVGSIIIDNLFLSPNYIVAFLFFLIAVEMIWSAFRDEKLIILNCIGILMFGFAVSIDSFLAGIGLRLIYVNIISCAVVFMLLSSLFTYIGLVIGGIINQKFGKYSTIFGGLCLIGLAINCLTNS